MLLLENGLLDFDLEVVDRLLNRSNNLLKNDINLIVVSAFSGSLPKVLRVVIPAATVWLIIWVARFTRISLNAGMFIRFLVNLGANQIGRASCRERV